MKLFNSISQVAYLMEKLGDQAIPFGKLRLNKTEQSLKWTCKTAMVSQAFLLGVPEVRVIQSSNLEIELMKKCSFAFKIDGQPVIEKLPLLVHHSPIPATESISWFHALGAGDKPCGIFVVKDMELEFVVTAPAASQSAQEIEIWLKTELYQGKDLG